MEPKNQGQWERMLKAGNLKNFSELAQTLGVTPQALSNHRKKGEISPGLLFKFAKKYNISIDWLLTGIGGMYKGMESSDKLCAIAVIEAPTDSANGRFRGEPELAVLNPEEIIYIGKLLSILRRPEKAAAPAVKISIDAFFKTSFASGQ